MPQRTLYEPTTIAIAAVALGAGFVASQAMAPGAPKTPELTDPSASLAKDQEAARAATAETQRLAGARAGAGSLLAGSSGIPSSLLASSRKTLGAG